MGRSHRTVDVRLKSANGAARRAAERLREISAARLAELFRLPPGERFDHLEDGALVQADRAALRQSIRKEIVRSKSARLRAAVWREVSAATHSLLRSLSKLEIVASTVIVAAWLALAWSNTGHRATLARPVQFLTEDQSGAHSNLLLPAGARVVVKRGWDGVYRVRHWVPLRGYETFRLPPDTWRLAP
jgi:hypothetical protein